MQRLVISPPIADLNTYINYERSSRFKGASLKKTETERVMVECKMQGLQPEYKPVTIMYAFYCENKKKDKSNVAAFAIKSIEDGLVQAGVLQNDGWNNISSYSQEFYIDEKNPRVEVVIL